MKWGDLKEQIETCFHEMNEDPAEFVLNSCGATLIQEVCDKLSEAIDDFSEELKYAKVGGCGSLGEDLDKLNEELSIAKDIDGLCLEDKAKYFYIFSNITAEHSEIMRNIEDCYISQRTEAEFIKDYILCNFSIPEFLIRYIDWDYVARDFGCDGDFDEFCFNGETWVISGLNNI